MIALIQIVKKADVKVNGKVISEIDKGILIFLGVFKDDSFDDALWLSKKVANARIFVGEEKDKIDFSTKDLGLEAIVVSQFTLCADVRKGNRPSFSDAKKSEEAEKIYNYFLEQLNIELIGKVKGGQFGAYMEVSLINEGPFTLIYETDGH